MNTKQKWINEVENSLDGLNSLEVNPYLYSKIINRLNERVDQTSPKIIWASIASFVVIITLNVFIITTSKSNAIENNSDLQIVAKQYQLINENTINYN
ncbi:MAG: hypothetical protein Q7W45_09550 [Bacteroidota bacterium]|nr:hypothetical protein [Bacteroidota bacterium]MDP3144076.1 hypothetical protein [Bacteroidota bacterium]